MKTLADDLAAVLERAGEQGVEIHVGPRRGALSPIEAADWLGVSPATVRRMLADGRLPHVELGSLRRIAISALERFVDPVLAERAS